jgi:uncharacterized protein (TIGR00369 family)
MSAGYAPPTINLRIDYLRPAVGTSLTATATIRRSGKSVAFVDVDIMNDAGILVAVGRANYGMTPPGRETSA